MMVITFAVIAVLCLIYYIMIVSYAGLGSAFSLFWIAMAVFFGGISVLVKLEADHISHSLTIIKNVVLAFCAIGIVIFAVVEGMIISGMKTTKSDDVKYVIVLGAQVRGTRVTKSLKYRLDAAYDYYQSNPDVTIIVTGGQGTGEDISEAKAMKDYLISKGMPDTAVIMEDRATNTSENIRFSYEFIDDKAAKVAVVSNDFHLYRAKLICKKQGYDVETIKAKTDEILFVNYMFREFFAIFKNKVLGRM